MTKEEEIANIINEVATQDAISRFINSASTPLIRYLAKSLKVEPSVIRTALRLAEKEAENSNLVQSEELEENNVISLEEDSSTTPLLGEHTPSEAA